MAAGLRQPDWARTAAYVGALAAVVAALLLLAQRVSHPSVLVPMAAAAALAVWLFGTARTGLALAGFAIYLACIDGPLKLTTDVFAVTLVRNVLLAVVVAGVAARWVLGRWSAEVPPLTGWVVAFCGLVAVQVLNPNNADLTSALGGVRQHLEFVPLFFFGYALVRSVGRLQVFLGLLLFLSAVNALVGLVQYGLTLEQLASWGPGYHDRIFGAAEEAGGRFFVAATGEARVRPLGLGPDAGFSAALSSLALPAGLALVATARRARWRLLAAAGVVCAVIGIVTGQNRAGVVAAVVAIAAFAFLAVRAGYGGAVLTLIATGVLGIGVASAAGILDTSSLRKLDTVQPTRLFETAREERGSSLTLVGTYVREDPFGAGLGRAGPAASLLPAGVPPRNSESEYNFLASELGVGGLVILLALTIQLLAAAVRGLPRVTAGRGGQLLLAALVAPLFGLAVLWAVLPVTVSTPVAPYFWFCAGALAYWLPFRRHRRLGRSA